MHAFSHGEERTHLLTGIDARIKLISALVILVMVLTCNQALFPLLVTLLCICLFVAMRIPLRKLLVRFAQPAFIILVLILIKFLFSGTDVMWSFDRFGIHLSGKTDGLMEGLFLGCRITGAVSLVAALGFSTPFTEFLSALTWLRLPKGLIEVLTFAHRYIFLLVDDAMVIYNAQKNRLGYSSTRRAFSSLGILAGSLTLKSFESSQRAAIAMMQRGYDGHMPSMSRRPFRSAHVAVSLLFLLVMGALWKM